MSKGAQTQLIGARSFSHPSSYVQAMYGPYRAWIWDEESAPLLKGFWRKKVFKVPNVIPLDLEIGPGAGDFLHYISQLNPNRLYLSIELKYKPLVQSARKIKQSLCQNARLIRYNARLVRNIFVPEEINNVYIYFPDPWPKKKHHKHRLIKTDFVRNMYLIQREGSFVEIKTDHLAYFEEMREIFTESPYIEQIMLTDLHKSQNQNVFLQGTALDGFSASKVDKKLENSNKASIEHKESNKLNQDNFITFFEKIFIKQNHPVCYARYMKG